jgi:mannose-6-phosphate isomerase-like protein (cupin superfamily)
MKYLYSRSDAKQKNVFGVDITMYGVEVSTNNLVLEETGVGMLQEFYDDVSTHMWFIIDGFCTFYIDDELVEAKANDVVVVPPNKRIYYFGQTKMLLYTTPAFDPKNEHHVRDVDPSESPYKN